MWRKIAKYKFTPALAPPTPTAAVDGSRYFPPRMENLGKRQPGVPQRARLKSAKRLMNALEERRVQAMSPQVKSNPLFNVSALIERLPVVVPPRTTWQEDFDAVQVRAMDEIESKLPPSIIKQQWEENPPWAVTTFKEYFGKHSDTLMPLVGPPPEEEAAATGDAKKDAASGKKQKGGKKGKEAAPAKEATPAEAPKAAPAAAKADTAAVENAAFQKAMADLGIEFAESMVDDDAAKAMKLHVDLNTRKDDHLIDFVAQSRITEADKKNDTKSLDRKLWHKLYLVVKRKGEWGFPSVQRKEKERLAEAVNRAVFNVFDMETREQDLHLVSACPAGYRPGKTAKEFFFRTQLVQGGNFERRLCKEAIEDYAWLTPTEIAELFYGKDPTKDEYQYLVRMFGDDWWEDPRDSDELRPVEDNVTSSSLKKLTDSVIRKRTREELERRAALEKKVVENRLGA